MLSDKDSCCLKIFKILLLDFFGVSAKKTDQSTHHLSRNVRDAAARISAGL